MSMKIIFSHDIVDLDDAGYLRALSELGVGSQEAQFMLSMRNGTTPGDVVSLVVSHADKGAKVDPDAFQTGDGKNNPPDSYPADSILTFTEQAALEQAPLLSPKQQPSSDVNPLPGAAVSRRKR